jgi:hypothetical protein
LQKKINIVKFCFFFNIYEKAKNMTKIKKSDLIQLIKEEAERLNKIQELIEEKNSIQTQLNEMYGTGEMEEGIFGNIKTAIMGDPKAKFEADANAKAAAWRKQGYRWTAEQWQQIMTQAAADGFKGILGADPKAKTIMYRPSNAINWGSAAGHTFGGGVAA